MTQPKPLNWTAAPDVGYTVARRPDGGMQLTFTDLSDATLKHWHDFALEHLFTVQQRTRNLYDLRQVGHIPDKAINLAVEVNNDPATRNLRVAIVVVSEEVRLRVREIAALSPGAGASIKLFSDMDEAEVWLSRPLDQLP
jgi:hypothetical protein